MNTELAPTEKEEGTAFTSFLHSKGIDPQAFALGMPEKYAHLEKSFSVGGATALDYAQKFHWNDLRIEFPWKGESLEKV